MAICDVCDNFVSRYSSEWNLWRDVYEGGDSFIDRYLKRQSTFETTTDFNSRKEVTYNSNYAQANINEIRNSIFSRMPDIDRVGGSPAYHAAMETGVDAAGRSMNSFIGNEILPELLVMQRVGIYVDRPPMIERTLMENQKLRCYLYMYTCEDIRAVRTNEYGDIQTILLRDHEEKLNDYGLIDDYDETFRLLTLTNSGVLAQRYRIESEGGEKHDVLISETMLKLKKIPFVLLDLGTSLMRAIARHQVALLNLSSTDLTYLLKANFPFYVEQYDNRQTPNTVRTKADAVNGDQVQTESAVVGPTRGRRYPRETQRPAFIHPSSEPLMASMNRQDRLKDEMRQVLHLAIKQLNPQIASAASKRYENLSLEAGLAFIGLTLADAERRVAQIWADYEGTEPATVTYPPNYELKSDDERRAENKELKDNLTTVPSQTYATLALKRLAHNLVASFATREQIAAMDHEIDTRKILTGDIEYMRSLMDTTTMSPELQADVAGLPPNEAQKASVAHAERVARINAAQSDPGSRGVGDLSANPNAAREEKAASRNMDTQADTTSQVRGEGK